MVFPRKIAIEYHDNVSEGDLLSAIRSMWFYTTIHVTCRFLMSLYYSSDIMGGEFCDRLERVLWRVLKVCWISSYVTRASNVTDKNSFKREMSSEMISEVKEISDVMMKLYSDVYNVSDKEEEVLSEFVKKESFSTFMMIFLDDVCKMVNTYVMKSEIEDVPRVFVSIAVN